MYLSMDGVDDYLQTPLMTIDEIVIDMETKDLSTTHSSYVISGLENNGYIYHRYTDGSDKKSGFSFTANGVVGNGFNDVIQSNGSYIINATKTLTNMKVNIFANQNGSENLNGILNDVKVYNGGVLQAHYDMSTGTVQDQSGNGNHATLTGGTWVDEGGGGTAVTQEYDTLNQIYADRTITADTTASIYKAQTQQYDITQSIFNNISRTLDIRIEQYEQQTTTYDTEISVYEAITGLYDTYQEIYSDSIVRTYNYDLSFSIYTERQTQHDTKQSYYQQITTDQDLRQAIYETQTTEGDINLIISAERQQDIDTLQQMYTGIANDYDMRQTFYDEDKALIGSIRLEANRSINVYLQASNDPINLQAKSEKVIYLKGVIQ